MNLKTNMVRGILAAAMLAGTTLSGFAAEDKDKLEWFRDAKLGLFVHWGPSSLEGVEISWARQDHPYDHPGKGPFVANEKYDALYKRFNPVKFDADAWMSLAKEAGFNYVVFTSKHHDGFALFQSAASRYNVVDATPFRRDVVKELLDNLRDRRTVARAARYSARIFARARRART